MYSISFIDHSILCLFLYKCLQMWTSAITCFTQVLMHKGVSKGEAFKPSTSSFSKSQISFICPVVIAGVSICQLSSCPTPWAELCQVWTKFCTPSTSKLVWWLLYQMSSIPVHNWCLWSEEQWPQYRDRKCLSSLHTCSGNSQENFYILTRSTTYTNKQ